MLNPLVGQKPETGALPTLYAATAPDVQCMGIELLNLAEGGVKHEKEERAD